MPGSARLTGLSLRAHVVDVVACWLHATLPELDALQVCLSADERARADRFRFERDRDRFVVARGRLRQLLGRLSGCPPEAVQLAVDARGKPRLHDGAQRLRFNVAHAADLMACAFTLDRDVGIDVERVRENVECDDLAQRFFAADEVRRLAALPPPLRRTAFFACWTRKEAVVKATGEGLARPLDSFVVSVDPDRAQVLVTAPELGSPGEWSLVVVPLPAAYHGTVAMRGEILSLRVWWWPEV